MWSNEDDLTAEHQAGASGGPQPVHGPGLQLGPEATVWAWRSAEEWSLSSQSQN